MGAGGRMGRAVLDSLREPFVLTAAFVGAADPRRGKTVREAGLGPDDVALSSSDEAPEALAACDVLLSFATPAADVAFAPVAAGLHLPFVIGTTGHSAGERERLASAAERIPLVLAPNFSVGIAVMQNLLTGVAPLRAGFDPSIIETHHAGKRDAPSGTAIALADTLGRALGGPPGSTTESGSRPVPISAIRGGGVPGDHTVILAGAHEVLRIEHRVLSRAAFAEGALVAARWVTWARRPGLYSFLDVLGDAGLVGGR